MGDLTLWERLNRALHPKTADVNGDYSLEAIVGAGSAIIGKVAIDQTTPGTTNGIYNTALNAGENLTLNRQMALSDWNITWITTQTTTTIKSGAGVFGGIIIPTPVASATVKGYDNIAGSGTLALDTITLPGTLLAQGPVPCPIDQAFATGLTIVTAGATMSVGVLWI